MLWIKSFHIIAVVTWFAAIFYLPRLFVYHAMSEDQISQDRFKIMERKLYRGIMTPSAVVAVALGIWLVLLNWQYFLNSHWFHVKILFVALLIAYHLWCGRVMAQFARDANTHSHRFYRVFNELPILMLVIPIILVVVKPF